MVCSMKIKRYLVKRNPFVCYIKLKILYFDEFTIKFEIYLNLQVPGKVTSNNMLKASQRMNISCFIQLYKTVNKTRQFKYPLLRR